MYMYIHTHSDLSLSLSLKSAIYSAVQTTKLMLLRALLQDLFLFIHSTNDDRTFTTPSELRDHLQPLVGDVCPQILLPILTTSLSRAPWSLPVNSMHMCQVEAFRPSFERSFF